MEEFALRSEGSIEYPEDWRALSAEAPKIADRLISEIPGFERMTLEERIGALDSLMQTLSYSQSGLLRNENRYVVREIGRIWDAYRAKVRMQSRLSELGFTD